MKKFILISILQVLFIFYQVKAEIKASYELVNGSEYEKGLYTVIDNFNIFYSYIDENKLKEETKDKDILLDLAKNIIDKIPKNQNLNQNKSDFEKNLETINKILEGVNIVLKSLPSQDVRDSYVIFPLYEKNAIKTDNKVFQLVVRCQIKNECENFTSMLDFFNSNPFKKIPIEFTDEEQPNKLIVNILYWKGEPKKWLFSQTYPFINSIVDVVIDNQYVGKYIIFGNAVKGFLLGKVNILNPLSMVFAKDMGFLLSNTNKFLIQKDKNE